MVLAFTVRAKMVAAHRFRSLGAGTSANLESGATYEKEPGGVSEELRWCGSNQASLNAFVVCGDNLAAKRNLSLKIFFAMRSDTTCFALHILMVACVAYTKMTLINNN